MIGGAGYYLGSFKDISRQNKNAFGPHLGLGFNIKLADRIAVVTEGIYRFVNLKDFTSELHPGYREITEGGEHEQGFWHYHHHEGDYHFHESHEDQVIMTEEGSGFNIRLSGFSLRAGISFRF
jgi:hypothetical protein